MNVKLAQKLVDILSSAGLVLAVAESCTAGRISSVIGEVPGCSRCFWGGWVVYSNQAKIQTVGVPAECIQKHGAVSRQVVDSLLRGVLERADDVDIAIAVSGIAGPGGASTDKPVGLVYSGILFRGQAADIVEYRYSGTRIDIQEQATGDVLQRLLDILISES